MNLDDEVFKNFLLEMGEKLEELENGLAELEEGFSEDLINKLFRAVHTIKGGGGFFGLTKVSELSHVFEDVLMNVREGKLSFGDHMISPFYSACDALKGMHESDDFGNNQDIGQLCLELKSLETGLKKEEDPISELGDITDVEPNPVSDQTSEDDGNPTTKTELKKVTNKVEVESEKVVLEEVESKSKSPVTKLSKGNRAEKTVGQNETIRVKVDLLNKLMELTGEIVLGRNQLLRQFADMEDKSNLVAMAHMISDLQQLVLQTRMQPIGGTFTKF
jgi:two-component system chemotaxis sensor kinase CheA